MNKSRLGVAVDPGGFHRGLALVAQQTLAPPAALGGRGFFRAGAGNHWSRRCGGRGSRRGLGRKRSRLAGRRATSWWLLRAQPWSLRFRCGGRWLFGWLREVVLAVEIRRAVELVGRLMQFRLRSVFGRTEWRLAIALPVAAAAAAATTTSTSALAARF